MRYPYSWDLEIGISLPAGVNIDTVRLAENIKVLIQDAIHRNLWRIGVLFGDAGNDLLTPVMMRPLFDRVSARVEELKLEKKTSMTLADGTMPLWSYIDQWVKGFLFFHFNSEEDLDGDIPDEIEETHTTACAYMRAMRPESEAGDMLVRIASDHLADAMVARYDMDLTGLVEEPPHDWESAAVGFLDGIMDAMAGEYRPPESIREFERIRRDAIVRGL